MGEFTQRAEDAMAELARRHSVSLGAVETLARAFARSGGGMAQFDHPELGGMGQWSTGMMMIADMFNDGLKARVSALCSDVASLTRDGTLAGPVPHGSTPANPVPQGGTLANPVPQGGQMPESVSLFSPSGGAGQRSWWPSELGRPASSGSQNSMHYACFPDAHRLAIQADGRTTVYDSGDHVITGFAQAQGGGQSLTFTSQHGIVRAADLKVAG